ncbi:hypothetical protein BT96DRAFT_1000703 [Gymnopus androsaceus JB14]|uniref:Uncharacterized protein n=1 Tax=Gymnopus androsaceus JB14 TaxID=1447944 RepID=A0A6A4H320_9AGAR|nr:hypothetical protein BT96DRAFT_1000703 [Gymnopus androsaceus JB14]
MDSTESRDLADFQSAVDSAHERIAAVYAEIYRASSENLDAASKLRTSVLKTSSAVHELCSRSIHYEKQCLFNFIQLRGAVSKSVRDGNIVRQLMDHVKSSSYSLNKQLQLVIARIPDIRNTLAEDPLLAQRIVGRLGAITPSTTQKPPGLPLRTLKNSDIMSMYLSTDTCAKVLEILEAGTHESIAHNDALKPTFDSMNVTKRTADSNSVDSILDCSNLQSLQFHSLELGTMDHASGSSSPLNATKPEACSEFESTFTRDLDTALRLKRYKEQKMDHLFQSIEALESEGRTSNKCMEEAIQAQNDRLKEIMMTTQELIDSRIESFDKKVNCLRNNIDTAFNLKDFPTSSQGVVALDFWKGTYFLSQLWELGRQLLYIQKTGSRDDIMHDVLMKLDRLKFEHDLSIQSWSGPDDGRAGCLRIFSHIGHVVLNNDPEKKAGTSGHSPKKQFRAQLFPHNSEVFPSNTNPDAMNSAILPLVLSSAAPIPLFRAEGAASVIPVLELSVKSMEEREGGVSGGPEERYELLPLQIKDVQLPSPLTLIVNQIVERLFWRITFAQPWTSWSSPLHFNDLVSPKRSSIHYRRAILLAFYCISAITAVLMGSFVGHWAIRRPGSLSEPRLRSSASESRLTELSSPGQELLTSHYHNDDKFRQLLRDVAMLNDIAEAESKRAGSQSSHVSD